MYLLSMLSLYQGRNELPIAYGNKTTEGNNLSNKSITAASAPHKHPKEKLKVILR
jgi:hypothetical protein